MASISGVSSSNLSSLYNSSNIVSGLASGMDTEGMIESLIQSYQNKINTLNQKVTKTEWKQDAYRSIISKAVGFSSKYASYTSSTNLLSSSFFSSAVKVATQGLNADKVSASGKTSSDISIDAVKQLATAAQFRTAGNLLSGDGQSIEAGEGVKWSDRVTLGKLNGSMALTYGNQTVSVNFDEVADVEALEEIKAKGGSGMTNAQALAELINQKLEGQKITFTSGGADTAENRIKAVANSDGSIEFTDPSNAGNKLYISGASGNVKSVLGLDLEDAGELQPKAFFATGLTGENGTLTRNVDRADYLSGKSMNISLDGTVKTITMPTVTKWGNGMYILNGDTNNPVKQSELSNKYAEALNKAVQEKFGDKIKVTNESTDGSLKLSFRMKNEGSDLIINTDVGEAMGIDRTATSYLRTSKTLEDLMNLDDSYALKDKDGKFVLDDDGNKQYSFQINGVEIGKYTKDTKLSTIINDINSNKDANVKLSYSQLTQEFVFTSKETGRDSKVELGGGLAEAMFGASGKTSNNFFEAYGLDPKDGVSRQVAFSTDVGELEFTITNKDTLEDIANKINSNPMKTLTASYNKTSGQLLITDKEGKQLDFKVKEVDEDGATIEEFKSKNTAASYTLGQDAVFTATVNGRTIDMVRSSNNVSMDGLTVTLKDTFEAKTEDEKVTFKSTTDADKIVDVVKTMIDDYNSMMAEIKSAYSTMPYQTSSGTFANYEPLTDDDKADMSEAAIERYEEKAKQGILFGDRNLSRMYEQLSRAFSPANPGDSGVLSHIGISASFSISEGVTTITLDEDKFRAALESEPELVQEAFTKTSDGGGTNGIMQTLKDTLDGYVKTTGEPKGILVQQAGTPLSSLSLMNNAWQTQIDNLNSQISDWQDKMSDQVDRYTSQFARLEQLMQQMNSQSSTLAGLMGG